MFTGIVQNLGKIVQIKKSAGKMQLCISSALPARHFKKGASIAVDGVCLTVESYKNKRFWVTAVEETLRNTVLGGLTVGGVVHLEAPLTLATPLGGHLVSGHVDGVGTVLVPAPRLRVLLPFGFKKYYPHKGSITVNGVSLTVAGLGKDWVEIAVIPETMKSTKLGKLKKGDSVNLEIDMIARYLEHLYASSR